MNPTDDPQPTPQALGESLAAQIGNQEWVLEAEDLSNSELGMRSAELASAEPETIPHSAFPVPNSDIPLAQADVESEIPPAPLQIIEAMLFIGGQPLQPAKAIEAIRGLTEGGFREAIEVLNRVYRLQNRPYLVASAEQGYTLTLRPRYRSLKEKLFGGPREARLTQPALDVLSLVAYRQPAAKNEIDSIRGAESTAILRQLVRLGLISVVQRAEAKQREVSYGTTPRFLELFNLRSLDELPQIGDPQRL